MRLPERASEPEEIKYYFAVCTECDWESEAKKDCSELRSVCPDCQADTETDWDYL